MAQRAARWVVVVAFLAAALCVGSTAALAQSPEDTARAEKLFDEGKALMDAKSYPGACAKFEESYTLVKGVAAQYFLARCLTTLGKTATAFKHYEEVAEISTRAGQPERAEVARQRMDELGPRLMSIRIDVTRTLPDLRIDCDGQAIAEASWGKPVPFDPGSHVVTAQIPGRAPWTRSIELTEEGSVRTVVIPNLADDDTSAPLEPIESDGAGPPPLLLAGIVVGGLGIVGLAAGGGMAAAAKSTYGDSDAFCDATGCDPQGLELVADARGLGDGATAMFIVGGALLAGGATMLVIATVGADDEAASAGVPSLTLGLRGGSLSWRF